MNGSLVQYWQTSEPEQVLDQLPDFTLFFVHRGTIFSGYSAQWILKTYSCLPSRTRTQTSPGKQRNIPSMLTGSSRMKASSSSSLHRSSSACRANEAVKSAFTWPVPHLWIKMNSKQRLTLDSHPRGIWRLSHRHLRGMGPQ